MSFEELDTEVVGPFGDNPSDRFAASSPFRGAFFMLIHDDDVCLP